MSLLQRPSIEDFAKVVRGKVVIVTGAAQGIGFAIAQLFANHGSQVIIADLNGSAARKAAETIGHGVVYEECNVSAWEDQISLFEETAKKFARIDIVVCNAGIDPEIVSSRNPEDPVRKNAMEKVAFNFLADEMETRNGVEQLKAPPQTILDVNVTGTIYSVKLALHHMLRLGNEGRIIVIGSAASYMPVPDQTIYSASKHAVLGFMRATAARQEVLSNEITVAMVAPWLTTTPMTSVVDSKFTKNVVASTPEDVAWAVGLIATKTSNEINGKSIWVQGKSLMEVEDSFTALRTGLMIQ